jgi:hypothetical protein
MSEALTLAQPTPMRLIELAVEKGADAEKLAILMDLHLRWEANEARKAYIAAIQQFKANPPDIERTKDVNFANRDGGKTSYSHAELDKITDIIGQALKRVGITHAWRTADTGGKITVTCVLTHEQGHAEDAATLCGPADTSGGKNSIQAIGSTVTYLERYTLLAATGLAAKGQDDDGKTEGMDENAITDYCIQMQDAGSFDELRGVFKECWEKAKNANDLNAKARFQKVYEARKKELQQ